MSDARFGKYRLLVELGHGGMADVFLAVVAGPAGSGFSKLVVLKRLRAALAEDPEFVAMLVDEARIAARLNHPNVVQTNEVGEVDGRYFIAMEYLDGQPLHRIQYRSKDSAELTREMQYFVVSEVLAGLHHAHELADYDGTPLHIVHRDMTPHNVFVTYEGQVKVVDFGIAKAAGRASETRQGIVKGKVRYMAPEQARGGQVDRRADLFAVGVMLWEIAAGRRLWKDMDDNAIAQKLLMSEYERSPRVVSPDVPEGIDRIVHKALDPEPEGRYADALAMRQDLDDYLASTGKIVEARRRLGPVVAKLFDDKRTEVNTVVERQLAHLATRSSRTFKTASIAPPATASGPTPTANGFTMNVDVGDASEAPTATGPTQTSANADLPTSVYKKKTAKSRLGRVVVAGAIVAGLGGLAVVARGRHADASRSAAQPTPPATSASTAEVESPPTTATAHGAAAASVAAAAFVDDAAPSAGDTAAPGATAPHGRVTSTGTRSRPGGKGSSAAGSQVSAPISSAVAPPPTPSDGTGDTTPTTNGRKKRSIDEGDPWKDPGANHP